MNFELKGSEIVDLFRILVENYIEIKGFRNTSLGRVGIENVD